ncbi:PP2C family protein-serine/threonine phosphatase [Actinomadura sp. WMMB 499]|uniref:PP2C family protein-serine/threonine phosphatase n=1 Tax=Actinomadura sp. WMMB 499 TaxID=1219491 RepID=UPI001246FC12|nr:SpoIIE family protein phosphatase [Actinomadura sp. WMMB 499]QFG19862.1 SpoIIE family protein phosphatase [Actinomadura sp. WMMB 499]
MAKHPAAPPGGAVPSDPATVLLDPTGGTVTGGIITGWSDGAARMFGLTARQALGSDLPGLLGCPAAGGPLAAAVAQAASGRPWSGTLPLLARSHPPAADGTAMNDAAANEAAANEAAADGVRVTCQALTAESGRTLVALTVALTVAPPWAGGLELLNEAGRRIGSTLDLTLTAREIVAVTVPRFADAGAIYVLERRLADDDTPPPAARDEGSLVVRRLAVAFADDDPGDWSAVFPTGEVVVYPAASPYARCVSTGRTVRFGGEDALDGIARRTGRVVDGVLDHVSLLAVPLTARGRPLGHAVFSRKHGRAPFGPADTALAAELGARAATGIDNACLYRREHRTATALQAGLLPTRVTVPPGLRIAHRYRPARAAVGGDWYDVVPLPDERVAIVIGDSVGHGVTAAAAMGQLRVAAHTLVSCDLPPAEVLARLDAIAQDLDAAQFATCLCVVCDPATRRCELACAGHPPPLLALPDGTARRFPVAAGLPLGVADPAHPAEYEQVSAELPPDGVLAFYTDGLVESRMRNIEEGIVRLASALVASRSDAGDSLEDTADGVLALLADQQGQDDIALLLVSPESR